MPHLFFAIKDQLGHGSGPINNNNMATWTPCKDKRLAVAIFNFDGSNVQHALPITIGDALHIIEETFGWYRGFKTSDRSTKGIFPSSFVALKPFKYLDASVISSSNLILPDVSIQPAEDAVSLEIVSTLREWHVIWSQQLFLNSDRTFFEQVEEMIDQLIDLRRELRIIIETQTIHEVKELKLKITQKIDCGNRLLSLDFIPRNDLTGAIIDTEQVSPIDLYQIHLDSLEPTHQNLNSRASGATRSSVSSHTSISSGSSLGPLLSKFIHMNVRELQLPASDDSFELQFSIYNPHNSSYVTEKFVYYINRNAQNDKMNHPSNSSFSSLSGPAKNTTKTSVASGDVYYTENISTVFTEIGLSDISTDLILLIQIYRIGKLLVAEGRSKLSSSSLLPLAVSIATQATSSAGGTNTFSQFNNQASHHPSQTLNNGKSIEPAMKFKRPFALAMIQLETIKKDDLDYHMHVKFFSCQNENDFSQHHEMSYKKQASKTTYIPNAHFNVTLRSFSGPDIKTVSAENPLIFNNVFCLTGRKGFPDIVLPGDVRNDLYVILESGEFEKGGKSIPKNIEATISLYAADGNLMPDAICAGAGIPLVSTYTSSIIYHTNSPKWFEMFKVLIPLEIFDLEAHIRIEFRHCSAKEGNKEKKLIGFSYIPINDEVGTILSDGRHELYVYKLNEMNNVKAKLANPKNYTCLAYGQEDKDRSRVHSVTGFNRSAKEVIHIRTQLSSTKLTQNGDLLLLLKWRSSPNTIEDSLKKLLHVSGEEIVKFLQDILDALFSLFSSHDGSSTHYTDTVFGGLIHIFSLLEEPKYEHFKPVLEAYIQGHFAAALIYKGLLESVKKCALSVKIGADRRTLDLSQRCFKSLKWMFKFTVQSRILFTRATIDSDDSKELFRQDLLSLFSCIRQMLDINDESVVLTQTIFLENFPSIIPDLLRVLTPRDVAMVTTLVFGHKDGNSVELLVDYTTPATLIKAKLGCFQEIIENKTLMNNYEARREFIDLFSRQLRRHLNQHQELKLCSRLISDMLVFLHNERTASSGFGHSISHLIELLVRNLLESLCAAIFHLLNSQNQIYTSHLSSNLTNVYMVCLLSLFRLMEDSHFNNFMSIKITREKKDILLQIFYVFKESFTHDLLPSDWSSLRMVFNHIILCTMQELSMTLITDFLDNESTTPLNSYRGDGLFDEALWNGYFLLSVAFLTQECLQLETFTRQKRESIIDRYGDMRVLMGFQILSMWEKLGDRKIHFIPSMVQPFLEVTLVPEKELRTATIPIFYDMIDAEVKATSSFKIVSSQLIDKLDHLVGEEGKGDAEFKQLLQTLLLDKIHQCTPTWKDQGIQFVRSISKLLELLLDYRAVMEGEENRDKHMSCTVNLLRFYKEDINRSEMYLRYIHKLCDLHIPSGNFTEAAFTLKLHADILKWSWNLVANPVIHPLKAPPAQDRIQFRELPEWQVKERLYLDIIDYFDKGKCWEEGIPLIKELAEFYEKQLFDYRKLSDLLRNQARFLDNIMNQLRPAPEYFRVGFFGRGFPPFLKNKLFVYRGLECEKIGAFTARLQAEFPQSLLLTKSGPPDESIIQSDGQHLQICSVKPIAEPKAEFDGQAVPDEIQSYYLANDVRCFIYDRPIHKGPVDKENEIKSLWIERSFLTTAAKLPGILRWSEVIGKKVVEVSPIERACEEVERKVRELEKLVTTFNQHPDQSIQTLSMNLQGVIEATVNGGIAKYQDAFFNQKYIALYSENLPYIRKLKQLINHQVRVLEGGLSLHGRLAPLSMQPFQKRLVETFTLMRQRFHDSSSHIDAGNSLFDSFTLPPNKRPSIINTPLPPIPRSMNHNNHQQQAVLESENESGYQLIAPEAQENDTRRNSNDDIYSIPIEKSSSTAPSDQSSSSSSSQVDPSIPPVTRRSEVQRVVSSSSDLLEQTPVLPERGSPAPPPPLPPSRYRSNNVSLNGNHVNNNRSQTRSLPNSSNDAANNQSLFVIQSSSSSSSSSTPTSQNGVIRVANSNFYSPCPVGMSKLLANKGEETTTAPTSSPSPVSPPPPLPPRNSKEPVNKNTNHFSTLPPPYSRTSETVTSAPALPSRALTKPLSFSAESTASGPAVTTIELKGVPARRSASTRRPPPPTPVTPAIISSENSDNITDTTSNGQDNCRSRADESADQVIASSSISVIPVVIDSLKGNSCLTQTGGEQVDDGADVTTSTPASE